MQFFKKHTNTDSELITGCRAGKQWAQAALYHRYKAELFPLCLRYADRRETAEDILQDCFVKIFQNLDQYTGTGSLVGWMKRIAVNTALDYYRKSLRQISTQPIAEVQVPEQSLTALGEMEAEELMRLIQRLPAGCRAVFNLYAIEGYSHREIGELLQITEGASRAQLALARKKLSDMVKPLFKTSHAG